MLNRRADKLELLRIAEAVALEKSIDKELIINSMELQKQQDPSLELENEIVVNINRDNGDIEIYRKLIISDKPENQNTEISLTDAINLDEKNKEKSTLVMKYFKLYLHLTLEELLHKQLSKLLVSMFERLKEKDNLMISLIKKILF